LFQRLVGAPVEFVHWARKGQSWHAVPLQRRYERPARSVFWRWAFQPVILFHLRLSSLELL
jgi:hypothetical protein